MTKKTVIVSNQVECLKCGDKPYSASVHDFKYCGCGNIAVDGGQQYLRRVGNCAPGSHSYRDLSITMTQETVDVCEKAVIWANETGRNELGVVFAVIRALRDQGYDLNSTPFA